MKNRKTLFWSVSMLLTMIFTPMFGQKIPKALREDNTEIRKMATKVEPSGWLYLDGETISRDGDLFTKHAKAMGLSTDDEMVEKSRITDELGIEHVKYQQYYKGVPVEGAEYIVHLEDCIEYLASGDIVEDIRANARPRIDEKEAFELAKRATKADLFAWDDDSQESELRREQEDSSATYLPSPEILFVKKMSDRLDGNDYRLAYRYLIKTIRPDEKLLLVDIDAENGSVIQVVNQEIECFKGHYHGDSGDIENNTSDNFLPTGNASTLYYGSRSIGTTKGGVIKKYYYLKDKTRGKWISTKDIYSNNRIKDKDNNWGIDDGKYTTPHWTIEMTYDYFKNVHGLNGTNDSGKRTKVRANWSDANASYAPGWWAQEIKVGQSNGHHLSAMDIMAHEFTHGVTNYSANLEYQGESGALNESFSDIFGTVVEGYTGAGSFDWTMGEDASFLIRDMQDPPSHGQPDTYHGANWYSGAGDHGGVHINSGVQNKWFYLLTQGGTQNGVSVQGIGIDKAAKIAFRNLTVYLSSHSDYSDARIGAINAAIDLYGHCSQEVIQTTNAWAAVGVGAQFSGNCVEITGPRFFCEEFFNWFPMTLKATGMPGSTFTWSNIPSSWTYTTYGAGNKYLKVTNVSPPYPQIVNVKATSSIGGSDTHKVVIWDCFWFDKEDMDPKDPTLPCKVLLSKDSKR